MDAERQKKIDSLQREIDEINLALDEMLKKLKVGPLIEEVLDMKRRVGTVEEQCQAFASVGEKSSVSP